MDQRESIESTIIKSERINKPCEPKPTMDMQCDAIMEILAECSGTAYELHYVKIPQKIITIDFDIKGEDGNKSFEKNLEAATKWSKTYAELNKSGSGSHLHLDMSAEKLAAAFDKLASDLYTIASDIVERWSQSLISLSDLSNDISLRTPDVIKKELKHAKNPMEIKRLNKELTAYYKDHKKRKGGRK